MVLGVCEAGKSHVFLVPLCLVRGLPTNSPLLGLGLLKIVWIVVGPKWSM